MQYFAVFGNPIAQSKSPVIHQMFAKQVKVNIEYTAILAPLDGFESAVNEFLAKNSFTALSNPSRGAKIAVYSMLTLTCLANI